MTSPEIHDYLNHQSTSAYFIEYEGFFTNHLSHGVIALHRLQATHPRLERFANWYRPKLETPESDIDDARPVEKLLGERTAFYRILQHYETLLKEKYNSNTEELIKGEYPKVSAGLAGSALHGTIHLGYSYSIGNTRGILEGLAYTYHSFRPVTSAHDSSTYGKFGNGSKDILTILSEITANTALQEALTTGRETERWRSLTIGRFQIGVCYILAEHGDELLKYTHSLKIDDTLRSADSSIDPVKLARRAVYWVVLAYASSANANDFFILHGVTCAWGIYQFISRLDKADAVDVLKHFMVTLFAVYIVQHAPALTAKIQPRNVTADDWAKLVERTQDADRDEHCYKLVQVCKEMAEDAAANGEEEHIYYQAACNAIANEFVIRPP